MSFSSDPVQYKINTATHTKMNFGLGLQFSSLCDDRETRTVIQDQN